MSDDAGRKAIALYAIGDRDPCDFVDMIREPETSNETLALLRDMLAAPGTDRTDHELNKLLLPMVEREIERRR